jgi:hypothetical protein
MNIYKETEIKERLLEHYHTGGGRVFYAGFRKLARHYNIKEGGVTDWSGLAGSGKTELLLEVLKNTSEWYGHKHLLHMPDAGTPEEVIGKLMHKMSGKQFKKFFFDKDGNKVEIKNRISPEEIERLLPVVMKTFRIFNPSKESNSKAVTPKEFWTFASENKKELGIFSAVIDSWNYMKHDIQQRTDIYLEDVLSYRNDLAESSKLHFHTIIHPRSEKKVDGIVQMPDMFSLKGGSEWSNNAKSVIIVHREWGSDITDIKINKAKPEIVGVKGLICLQYDIKSGSFYEFINGQKYYASRINVQYENESNPF